MTRSQKKHAIVGLGAVGRAIKTWIEEKNDALLATFGRTDTLEIIPPDTDFVWLSPPDNQLEEVIQNIASGQSINPKTVFIHCSGALSVRLFYDSGIENAVAAHPIAPFLRGRPPPRLEGLNFVLEGKTPSSLRGWLEGSGAQLHPLPKNADKVRYHAGCVIAANLTMPLLHLAFEQLKTAGIAEPAELLGPLLHKNLENALAQGPLQAMSGPLKRGDTQTTLAHTALLQGDARTVYEALSRYAQSQLGAQKRS